MIGMKISYRVDAPNELPERIKAAVEASNKSMMQICADAGISSTALYSLMKGSTRSIRAGTLNRLAKSLGVDDCFGGQLPPDALASGGLGEPNP
jgi:transcriptional regulator with XRE-family HTH domain